ncbi:hypothetical protein [Aliirhizobium cellulosilyticum]|uniref:Uncharacterized protein n=1 Tax=Aliirhizobium cellulosilyticum TaxID=393664 RepID=A0A7W6TBP4_9HYPH|nr:hypothetical protein [Rhizobium cellulosilyticum]MBB4347009.1 hypothetical protein [Rhizobium cellulosilyticum]MBB4410597.1 hypothetical protein [Rhizobium cellulosilyticum]MBB4445285.1 hypothetical protein [Rhizobium cellulosilyticum]
MSKVTKFSYFTSIDLISPETVEKLSAAGFEKLGDMDEVDFARIEDCTSSTKETFVLYNAGIKSGATFILDRQRDLETLPNVSGRTAATLEAKGYLKLSDLEGAFFPDIYNLIGYGPGKHLLLAAILASVKVNFEVPDKSDEDWKSFIMQMVDNGLICWEDVAVAVCGELNPPQVGTQVASAVKHNYPRGKTMKEVWQWLYSQPGTCAVSGKRMFLEADHKEAKEQFIKAGRDVKDADTLENFQLLTKRENVIKRGSHRLGGLSFAPAASVLVYVLLEFRPKTLKAFIKLCRSHGLTMSEIRMQEAWALAIWLSRDGLYEIDREAVEEAIEEGGLLTPREDDELD